MAEHARPTFPLLLLLLSLRRTSSYVERCGSLLTMSSSSAVTPPTAHSGTWDGSEVHDDHVDFLRKTRQLPGEDLVRVRLALREEISPAPQEGERVVFRSHCLRGLGLPASNFFRSFLEFYGLQPHHLTPTRWCCCPPSSPCAGASSAFSPPWSSRGSSSTPSSARACRACRLRVAPSSRCGGWLPTTPSPSSR